MTTKNIETTSVASRIVKISNELRVDKDGKNSFANYNYFKPDDILIALNPLLEKYNLIALFNMPFSKEKEMYEGTLDISDVEDPKNVIVYRFDIPLTEVKGASKAQGAGATQTYCKRYMLMSAFNIADNSNDLDNHSTFVEKPRVAPIRAIKSDKKEVPADVEEITCDLCGAKMEYREGEKVDKEGNRIPWRGVFCPNSGRYGKCKKQPVWLPHTDPNKDRLALDDLKAEAEISENAEYGL